MTTILHRFTSFAALSLLIAATGLRAQTAPAAPATPAKTGEEVIQLSPFTIAAQADRGYAPSETLTGTRVATKIIDLPYTVNVLTSEFFEDYGMFELTDNVTQIGGFTGLDIGGNFNLRGFSSSNQLRDGFFRLGRYGSSNIDRMEIIKGSNAAIYGRTSPGGMVNMISKTPKAAANQKLSYNYGDYGTQRSTLEATGPFLPGSLGKTNYVLTASYFQRDFDQDYARNRNQEYYGAIDHVFADGSKLFFSAEYFHQMRHAAISAVPLITDQRGTASNTDDLAVGYALNLGKYNASGPNSELNRGNTSFTVGYDKKLSSVFSTRLSGNYFKARRWDYNYTNLWGAIAINQPVATAPIRTSRGAVPNRGRIYEDGGGFQGDLLAHYWSSDRKIEHRTLLTFDFNDYYQWNPTQAYAANTNPDIVAWSTARFVNLDADYNPTGPIAYFPKWYYESPGQITTRSMKKHTRVLGGLLRQQSALFENRLLAYAGLRFDSIRYRHRDEITPASSFTPYIPDYVVGQYINRDITEVKPNLGLNYKISPGFRIFANYSESYFIDQGDTPLAIADPGYKSEIAGGYDYGFKGSLLNERLSYTVSGFYIDRENVSVEDIEESPPGSSIYVPVSRRDGNQRVRGYEADLNYLITDELSFLGSYGRVDSVYTDYGTAYPAAIGRAAQWIAPYNGSVNLKYTPRGGWAKGFSTNIGVTFVGATPTAAPNAGDTYVTDPRTGARTVVRTTGEWNLRAPSYQLWSLGLRYQIPSKSNTTHMLSVNVNNLLDEEYLRAGSSTATRLRGEHRAFYFTYTLNHKGTKF